MKKYLLSIAGLTTLILLVHVPGFAQKPHTDTDKDTSENHLSEYDEIIIKRKDNKDAKVTIEIKDGKVFVDGKPVSDYDNDNLSIRKKKVRVLDGRTFSFSGPDGQQTIIAPGDVEMPELQIAPSSPFRNYGGTWNFSENTNRALLGVSSEKPGGESTGAKIKQVNKGSAAEKAGLHEGDLITKVDEIPVDGPESLSKAIHKYNPEDKVTITFKRDGKEQKVTATLGKSDSNGRFKMIAPKIEEFNFGDGDMAPLNRGYGFNRSQVRLGIKAQDTEDGKGVKVLDVDDESAAEKAGIKEGDIITTFDGKEINSVTALAEVARASKAKVSVKVNLLRNGKAQEVEVKTPRKLRTADL